jgi:hypothetical protein
MLILFVLFLSLCYLCLAILHWLHQRLPARTREQLLAVVYLAVALAQIAGKRLLAA